MKLYSSPTSPYARKVRIMIIELGLENQIEIVNTAPMNNPDDLQAFNPIGKVPCLVLGDGQSFYDSPVICEYIDATNGETFLPKQGDVRWDCLRRQALADGVMDASFSRTVERLKSDQEQSSMWLERWVNAIGRGVNVIEKDMSISAGRFDLGDITTACALGYLDLRHGDLDWRKGREPLADWFEKISDRPSIKSTVPA